MYLRRAIWACEPWLWASSLFRRSSRSVAPCLWSALGLRIVPICVRAWPAPTPHRADAIAGGWPSSSTPEPSSPAAGGIVSVSRSRRVKAMVTAHRSTKEKTRGDRLRACDLASVSRNETRINMRASRERRDKANADRRTVTHVHTHTRTETRTQSAYNNCFASRFLNSLASHPWWQRRQTTRSGRRRCDAARPTRGQCPTTDCPRIVIQFQTNRRITDGSATDHTRPLPASKRRTKDSALSVSQHSVVDPE